MTKKEEPIQVFEHDSIRCDRGEKAITPAQFHALEKYFGKGVPYYSLIHKGVKFNEYVGVIQVGKTVIEVLPKINKDGGSETSWREVLIDMLRVVHGFEAKVTSSSKLNTKANSILDLYVEMFIVEMEFLVRNGLFKQYRRKEGNSNSLKGSLLFSKHIQQNLIHKERFYVRHATYDVEHKLHFILYKTILLLNQINTNAHLSSRIGSLLLNFPEMPDIKVTEQTFERLVFNRKNQHYRKAIEISRLLLLRYHPDLSSGRNHVLALMFDMNKLWEQFVLVSLKKADGLIVKGQNTLDFWKPSGGRRRTIRPDLVIRKGDRKYVIDTKWKLVNNKPSMDDLRQMYVYHHFFRASKVALLYPGDQPEVVEKFLDPNYEVGQPEIECGLLFTEFKDSVRNWQGQIALEINSWMNESGIR